MRRASIAFLTFVLCVSVGSTRADTARADTDVAQIDLRGSDGARSTGPLLAWPARTLAAPETDADSELQDSDASVEEQPASDTAEESKEPSDVPASERPWHEAENEKYTFVGLRARMIYIPTFMFDLFQADGGKAVLAPSFGPEYVTRRNGFEVDTWLTYTSYGMDDAPFKAKSDPDAAYEIVNSELKAITVGADFLWTHPLNDKGLSLMYGAGAGIGLVFGDLRRNQAYPPDGQPGDPEEYEKCPGPNMFGDYCDDDNDHYGDYTEPSWLDGGSKPLLFPWIALPQVGLRWKPSRQFVLRVDTGLSFPGPFFFGVSGQYGLL